MAFLKCKMCGGELNIQDGMTVAECEYCGTTQTLPKLVSDDIANLYDRANHFRRNNEFDKAEGIYERILSQTPEDAEAYWSLVLCRYGIEYVEDPATRKRVPTVNRAQYTSIFDDENYKSAIEHADAVQRRVYEEEAAAINEIQKGILAISQKEEPFDVFICYKESDNNGRRTPDSVLATDLYHQLTNEGFKVFFARITLEDKLGTAYEPYIFAALNSAKVMVVLGTKPEYFNAVWVKNEWSRYLALVKQSGGKKVLIPAYRDMDPYDLPEEFSHLQAQDMSKLGFMQDLIRGIKKITGADKPKSQPQVVTTGTSNAGSSDIAPLLKRMFMYLEDGEWDKANEYSERVLDKDPENAEAYVGKLMAELRVHRREDLGNQKQPFDEKSNFKKAIRFGDDKLNAELNGYITHIIERNKNEIYDRAVKVMNSAKTESDYKKAAEIFNSICGWRDADALAEHCFESCNSIIFSIACSKQESDEEKKLAEAADIFEKLNGYKDSTERAEACKKDYYKKKAEREKREAIERAEKEQKEKEARMADINRLAKIRARISSYQSIVAAVAHTFCVKSNGTVLATKERENSYWNRGQYDVSEWTDIIAVTAGPSHTIGLKSDGTVIATRISDNEYDSGQCQVYSWRDIIAVSAGSRHTVGLKSNGTVVATNYTGDQKWNFGQCNVSGWSNIVAIAAGEYHTIGLKSDGTVLSTKIVGDPYYNRGQCDVSDWTDIVAIAAGDDHSIGLKADGTVLTTKYIGKEKDYHGQCDVSGWKDIVAVSAGFRHTVGIKSDGTVVATRYIGDYYAGQCDVNNWKGIIAVSAGSRHTVGIKSDGTVVATKRDTDYENDTERFVSGWKLFKSEAEKESDYDAACRLQEAGTCDGLNRALAVFNSLQNYKDSPSRAKTCYSVLLNMEKNTLNAELSQLKGIFSGKRRRAIEARLVQIDVELNKPY